LVKAGGVDFTVRLPGDARLSPGETIPLEFRRERIHVFDRETDRRLNADRAAEPRSRELASEAVSGAPR
jgi:multiple sugar transport system ATP-binding protein